MSTPISNSHEEAAVIITVDEPTSNNTSNTDNVANANEVDNDIEQAPRRYPNPWDNH